MNSIFTKLRPLKIFIGSGLIISIGTYAYQSHLKLQQKLQQKLIKFILDILVIALEDQECQKYIYDLCQFLLIKLLEDPSIIEHGEIFIEKLLIKEEVKEAVLQMFIEILHRDQLRIEARLFNRQTVKRMLDIEEVQQKLSFIMKKVLIEIIEEKALVVHEDGLKQQSDSKTTPWSKILSERVKLLQPIRWQTPKAFDFKGIELRLIPLEQAKRKATAREFRKSLISNIQQNAKNQLSRAQSLSYCNQIIQNAQLTNEQLQGIQNSVQLQPSLQNIQSLDPLLKMLIIKDNERKELAEVQQSIEDLQQKEEIKQQNLKKISNLSSQLDQKS